MEYVLITMILYFACVVFGITYNVLLLKTKWLDRIKLNDPKPEIKKVLQHMPLVFLNITILAVLISLLMYLFQDILVMKKPSIVLFVFQFFLYLIFDDMIVYLWHRILHENKYLLRKVHSIHHRVRYPTPLEFIYVHPVEWIIAPLGIVFAALTIFELFGQVNIYILWAYAGFRTLVELDIHSSTRTVLFKYMPFFVDPKHHNIHHQQARGNYSSMLRYLDLVFKTEIDEQMRR